METKVELVPAALGHLKSLDFVLVNSFEEYDDYEADVITTADDSFVIECRLTLVDGKDAYIVFFHGNAVTRDQAAMEEIKLTTQQAIEILGSAYTPRKGNTQ